MPDPQALTHAFLADHPAEAARVVETLPVADAAALLATIPARIGAPVMRAMLATAASRLLEALADSQALALLAAAGTQSAVSMLRHVPEPRRTRLIGGLPTVAALASRLLLGFPEDAVGAWCDPEVIALAPATRAADAIERLRQGHERGADRILCVDAERKLAGEVRLEALLHAPPGASLATLMRPVPASLPAMMPIAAAAALRAWEQSSTLPVVDHGGALVGVLRRTMLARALRERSRQRAADSARSVTSIVAGGYWNVVAGLAAAALAILPRVDRTLPEDR